MKTLEMIVIRRKYSDACTIGELWINGERFCYTLEDVVRRKGEKIAGKTAIPPGRYEVVVTMSTRFKRLMCLLVGVPYFAGIRMHGGNTAADTEGCILVAKNLVNDTTIQGTMEAPLTALVQKALAGGGKVFVTVADTNGS